MNGYGFQIDSNCAQTARVLIKKRCRRCLKGSASPVTSGMLIPAGTAHARKIISSLFPWLYSQFRLLRQGSTWPFFCSFLSFHSFFIRALHRSRMISHKLSFIFHWILYHYINVVIVKKIIAITATIKSQ